jgi:hypothetical protein
LLSHRYEIIYRAGPSFDIKVAFPPFRQLRTHWYPIQSIKTNRLRKLPTLKSGYIGQVDAPKWSHDDQLAIAPY